MTHQTSFEFLNFVTHQFPSAVQIQDPKSECDSVKTELTEEILIDSKSEDEDLTQHYELPMPNNFANESLDYDSRENKTLQLELQEANEQCRYFKTKLEAATGELTKANELLNAEKMFRSKIDVERDSLACLAEKIELILLKYEQHSFSADEITLNSSKMTHHWSLPFDVQIKDPKKECNSVKTELTEEILIEPKLEDWTELPLSNNFANESLDCDNQWKKILQSELQKANEQCLSFKTKLEVVNEELVQVNELLDAEKMFRSKAEIKRDSLARLAEKLKTILVTYNQQFSSALKIVKSSELLEDVKFTSELDLKIEYESDSDRVDTVSSSNIKRSLPSPNNANNKMDDEINGTDVVYSTSIKNGRLFIKKESVSNAEVSKTTPCTQRKNKEDAKLMKGNSPKKPKVRSTPIINKSSSYKKNPNSCCRCDICGKLYANKRNLTKHKLHVHEGVKPFKCSKCNKAFATNYGLKVHGSAHSSRRPFQCSICNQSFKDVRHRDYHVKVIHGDAGFHCAHCVRKFEGKNLLIRHIKTKHLPEIEKPYKCTTCDKSFLKKENLNQHQAVHISKKSYKCSMCDKRFTSRRYKIQHERRRVHMEGFRFFCAHCGRGFRSKEGLSSHIRRLHL